MRASRPWARWCRSGAPGCRSTSRRRCSSSRARRRATSPVRSSSWTGVTSCGDVPYRPGFERAQEADRDRSPPGTEHARHDQPVARRGLRRRLRDRRDRAPVPAVQRHPRSAGRADPRRRPARRRQRPRRRVGRLRAPMCALRHAWDPRHGVRTELERRGSRWRGRIGGRPPGERLSGGRLRRRGERGILGGMAATEMTETLRYIDSDGHILEHATGMPDYAPREFRDRIWHIETDESGQEWLHYNGQRGPANYLAAAGTAGLSDEERARSFRGELRYTEVRPAAYNAKARLQDMDTDGIDLAVLYPTMLLGLQSLPDVDFGAAQARAYNDWCSDHVQEGEGRLFGAGAVPPMHEPD